MGVIGVMQQNRLIRAFTEAEATTPETAATFEDLGIHPGYVFRRLAAQGVFREAGGGRYYIDKTAMMRFLRRRMAIFAGLLVLAAALLLLMLFGGR